MAAKIKKRASPNRDISDTAQGRLSRLGYSDVPAFGNKKLILNVPGEEDTNTFAGDLTARMLSQITPRTGQNIAYSRLMSPEPLAAPLVPPKNIDARSDALSVRPSTTQSQARKSAEESEGITRPMYGNARKPRKD